MVVDDQNALDADTAAKYVFSSCGAQGQTGRLLGRAVVTGVNRSRIVSGNGTTATSINGTSVNFSDPSILLGQFGSIELAIMTNDIGDVSQAYTQGGTITDRLSLGALSSASGSAV